MKQLFIISCPFGRTARYLLSSELYRELAKRHDILVVSPFANDGAFVEEFASERVRFLSLHQSGPVKLKRLYGVSESCRMHGFWCRYRNDKRIGFLWQQLTRGLFKRSEKKFKSLKILKMRIEGILGQTPLTWSLIDNIFGDFFYDTSQFDSYLKKYENVVVVQVASFEFQERLLGYLTKKKKLKSVLLPYTTDQIGFNGHLISDFDLICPQGKMELEYLDKYHPHNKEKVFTLGSIWFRNFDKLRTTAEVNQNQKEKNGKKTLLYLGAGTGFYSLDSELNAVDSILEQISSKELDNVHLVYRPVPRPEEKKIIQGKYLDSENIRLDFPDKAINGLAELGSSPRQASIDLLNLIYSADAVVMSGFTSFALDFLYIGTPIISHYDPSSEMFEKCSHKNLIEGDAFGLFKYIPVTYSTNELKTQITKALTNPKSFTQLQTNANTEWDSTTHPYPTKIIHHLEHL